MDIEFYCGIGETRWNHHDVQPFGYACISPTKGKSQRTATINSVYVPEGTKVIQDSGAFSDNWSARLTFEAALRRQMTHADKYHYAHLIEYRASYDLLIDEVWNAGNRTKRRWTVAQAESAVETTVAAAQFIAENRQGLNLVLSAQGVDAPQYLRCTKEVLPFGDWNRDALGLGGWCIIGKLPKQMMPVFKETVEKVIPFAAREGVKRVHIWGVVYPKALGLLLDICDEYNVKLSTDSAAPSYKPAFGDWGFGEWRDNGYKRHPTATRGLERQRHVKMTREWLGRFRSTQWYRPPRPVQLVLL